MHNAFEINGLRILRGVLGGLAAASLGMVAGPVRADVVGIGDIAPFIEIQIDPETTIDVPDLPQFGGRVEGNNGKIVVGGTGQQIGGTNTGQMTIDIPADTDPLESRDGVIGGDATEAQVFDDAIGQVRILSLNSEWRIDRGLIIGGTGQGFLELIDGAKLRTNILDVPEPNVPDLIIGEMPSSQGFALLDGFGSQMSNTVLSVGHGSTGRIEVLNRASLDTRQEAIIGNVNDGILLTSPSEGIGNVLLDGRGTRWNIGTFDPLITVSDGLLTLGAGSGGDAGRGTLEVRNEAFVRVKGTTTIGADDDGFGAVFVSGQFTTLWSFGDLIVGNDNTTLGRGGIGELHVDDDSLIRADEVTTVGRRGLIEFAGGRLLTPVINNSGVIRGSGRIDSEVVNLATGNIRNAAAIANNREQMLFSGEVTNSGLIESIGGEMEFQETVTNTADGQIAGRNAIFRFRAEGEGLLNQGQMIFGAGESDVFGAITNANTGEIAIAHDANVVFYDPITQSGLISMLAGGVGIFADDMIFTSSSTLSYTIRDLGIDDFAEPQLQVAGDLTLGGVIDLSQIDFVPEVGDEFLLISASDVSGTFATIIQPDFSLGFGWEVVTETTLQGTDYVIARAVEAVPPTPDDADFNGDGVVDGFDLAAWEANFGTTSGLTLSDGDADNDGDADGFDLLIWQQQYGLTSSTATVAAVPEPSTALAALCAVAVGCLYGKRRR